MKLLIYGWGYLEADFLHYYNLRMQDVLSDDSYTVRLFGNLVKGLPAESAYARFIANRNNYKDGLIQYDESTGRSSNG